MNLYTYLRIKQAAGPRYASDATPEEIAEWTMNDIKGQQAIQQIPELQSQLDEAIDKNNKYYFDNEKNESNWQDYMADAVKSQNRADDMNKSLAKAVMKRQEALSNMQDSYAAARERAKQVLAQKDQQISDLYGRAADFESQLGVANKQLNRADAKNKGRANTIRRQEEQLANQASMLADNDASIDRMRRNASIGGAVGGAAIGGGVGYAGSNWLANKLKLTGRKALIAKLLGTAAGSALGGAGGYYLGRNI